MKFLQFWPVFANIAVVLVGGISMWTRFQMLLAQFDIKQKDQGRQIEEMKQEIHALETKVEVFESQHNHLSSQINDLKGDIRAIHRDLRSLILELKGRSSP